MIEERNDYGISKYIEQAQLNVTQIGRVIKNEGYHYQVYTIEQEIISATVNAIQLERVIVGDFVEYIQIDTNYFITHIYPRHSIISKASNTTAKDFNAKKEEQILATNVDKLFILIASDQRFSIGKLERYLLAFYQEAIEVNVLITKADLSDKTKRITDEINKYYPDLNILTISIYDEVSIEQVKHLIGDNSTIALLGSSGVGKSSLINALNHVETEVVGQTRKDGKGKHTTTYTTLIPLVGMHSYLVDTPGFKGIDTLNEVDSSVLYSDIHQLSTQCKFSNCQHDTEPGCAVKRAIQNGELSQEKYERFLLNNKKMLGLQRYEAKKEQKKDKAKKKYRRG